MATEEYKLSGVFEFDTALGINSMQILEKESDAVVGKLAEMGRAGDKTAAALTDAIKGSGMSAKQVYEEFDKEIARLDKRQQELVKSGKIKLLDNGAIGGSSNDIAEYRSNKATIEEETKSLKALKQATMDVGVEQQNTGNKTEMLRTQMSRLRDNLAQLNIAGKQNTEEYRQTQAELSRLGTAYRIAQREQLALTTGATQWGGLISGVQGAMGAYSAFSGVLGLVCDDEEKLMKIQTNMQSVMGVLMGMQQVANTLHETSAFRITTLATVSKAYHAVTLMLGRGLISLGLSATAAKVAIAGLYATLTLGISLAIQGLIEVITRLIAKHQAEQEILKQTKKSNEELAGSYSKLYGSYEKLQKIWSQTNGEKEKLKFIKRYANELKELDGRITDVATAEKVFGNQSQAFLNAMMERAEATAKSNVAVQLYEKVFKAKIDAQTDAQKEIDEKNAELKENSTLTKWQNSYNIQQNSINRLTTQAEKIKGSEDKDEQERYKSLMDNVDKLKSALPIIEQKIAEAKAKLKLTKAEEQDILQKHLKEQNDETGWRTSEEQAKTLNRQSVEQSLSADKKLTNLLGEEDKDKDKNKAEQTNIAREREEWAKNYQAWREQLNEIIAKKAKEGENAIANAQIEGMEEGYSKQRAKADQQHKEKLQAIAEFYNEQRKKVEEEDKKRFESNPDNKGKQYTSLSNVAADAIERLNSQENNDINTANIEHSNNISSIINSALQEYKTFDEQIRQIETKRFEDMVALWDSNISGEKFSEIENQINAKADEQIAELQTKAQGCESFIVKVFADLASNSKDVLKEAIENAKELVAFYQSAEYDVEKGKKFGVTKEQYNTTKNDPQQIKAFTKSIDEAQKKLKGLQATNPFAKLKQDLDGVTDSGQRLKIIIGFCCDQVKELTHGAMDMAEAFGMSHDDAQFITETLDGAADMAKNIASGNYIAAAAGVFSMIGSIFSFGAKRTEEARKAIREYAKTVKEALDDVQTYLQDKMNKAGGMQAFEAYNEALQNLQHQLDATREGEIKAAKKYSTWSHSELFKTRRTIGNYLRNLYKDQFSKEDRFEMSIDVGVNWKLLQRNNEIANYLNDIKEKTGVDISHPITLFDMNSDQIRTFKNDYAELWAKIPKNIREALDSIEETGDQIEELKNKMREALTDISLDSVENSLKDLASNVNSTMADASKSVENMLRNAILRAIIQGTNKDKIEAWYKDFAGYMEDGILTGEEAQQAKDEWKDLYGSTKEMVDNAYKVADLYDSAARDAETKGLQSITQEQADVLNGRVTAIQGHTFNIQENTRVLVSTSADMLEHLAGIDKNTLLIRQAVETINTKGVRIS